MKLLAFTIIAVVALASAEETKDKSQEKRGAVDVAYSTAAVKQQAPAVAYTKVPASSAYKSFGQGIAYQPQYVSAPAQVKYAAQAGQVAYQHIPQQYSYEQQYEPQTQYVAQQQYVQAAQPSAVRIGYAAQPAQVKYAAAPQKLAYQQAVVSAPAPVHYSPASSVSTFQYSSPYVTYSNLGLISQNLGKLAVAGSQPVAYSAAPQQVAYAAAPQQVAYAAAPQVQYSTSPQQFVASPQQQVAYSSAPAQGHYQGAHSAPQPIYVSSPFTYSKYPSYTQ